jgi:4-amino-4-deoxy-L-arabinose transferase-like glycosyltransferase
MENVAQVREKLASWSESRNALLFVLCVSTVLKVSMALFNMVINVDGILYISAAQSFASGNFQEGLAIYPMPLYPLLIALVHWFVPNWVTAGRVISITSSILVLVPLFLLSRELFDRKAAFWACLLFAISPLPNEWAVDVLRNPPFLFCFAWAVYFGQHAVGSKTKLSFFLAGLFCWLAVLLRLEGVFFFPLYLLFLFFLALRQPQERVALSKGILIWVAVPVFSLVTVLAVFGPEGVALNRFDEVARELKNLYRLDFLETYQNIYAQLETLENSSPYPSGKQNLAEIARHYMHTLYLLGLLETFLKVTFALFIVPLAFGLRNSVTRVRVFVLAVLVAYLLLLYYKLVTKDFIQDRFMLAPAFLVYPWIGAGMERMFTLIKHSSMPRLFSSVFLLIFLASPVYYCAELCWKEDYTLRLAGEWLAESENFDKAKMLTTSSEIALYAGRLKDTLFYEIDCIDGIEAMDQFALSREIDVIALETRVKKKNTIPEFRSYEKVKEFIGGKRVVTIYRTDKFPRQ